MGKSLEFFSLDEGLKEKMSKGPEYQVPRGAFCKLDVRNEYIKCSDNVRQPCESF